MRTINEIILEDKKVSVWGIGYLGYTTILRLERNGFNSVVYDITETLSSKTDEFHPCQEQVNSWSKNGKIPEINFEKVEMVDSADKLFNNKIHIISFPSNIKLNYKLLSELFIINKEKLKDCLVIFQSAGVPKSIEKDFCNILEKNNIHISVATAFRSDWTIEDFFNKSNHRVISGNNEKAISKTEVLLKLLNLKSIKLANIEEAEVYENTKNALSYTLVAYFNQLSLSYPHININEMSKQVLNDIEVKSLSLGVSAVDYKSEQSCENILRGSSGDFLSILKESNTTNISFLFYYVNLLKSKNIDSVTILGLSSYNSMKDFRFSPSVILAEYLNKENIKVYVHDENLDKKELLDILPYCEYVDINRDAIVSETVIIMSLCKEYKFFTQRDIDNFGLSEVKYIIDNTGFFKNFTYSGNTLYHQLCDGQLEKVIN